MDHHSLLLPDIKSGCVPAVLEVEPATPPSAVSSQAVFSCLAPKRGGASFPNALCDAHLCVLAGRGLQMSLSPTQPSPTGLACLP